MPREADISLNEKTFILQALQENLRLDGRSLDEYRAINLEFGKEYGHAQVQLGKTRVATRISADIVTPPPERKFEGSFTITTELSPMASPTFEVGRPTTIEALLSRILEKTVRRSSALDTESLCLVAGSKCFHIRADVHVIVHDGNILDAACICLIAALQHFRRPDVTIEGGEITVWTPVEREPVKLTMLHHPLCVSFSYFDSGNIAITDATAAEEKCREGELVVSVNKFGEVCQIAKYGGIKVDAVSLLAWTKASTEKAKKITAYIQERLAEEERKNDPGGIMTELRADNER